MKTVLIRLAELLGLCMTLSALSCALWYYKIIPRTESAYGLVLIVVSIIFLVSNAFMLRQCFFDLRNVAAYYLLNYLAYFIFMVITYVTFRVFGEVPYAWMFNTLKLAAFTDFDLSSLRSTFVMHLIMLVLITVAPIGMEWVFDLPDEIFDEEEDDFEDDFEETPEDLPPEE